MRKQGGAWLGSLAALIAAGSRCSRVGSPWARCSSTRTTRRGASCDHSPRRGASGPCVGTARRSRTSLSSTPS